MNTLWLTILLIGLATYLARALPLFWQPRQSANRSRAAWLDRLGPCLLAAMAATVILPIFMASAEDGSTLEVLFGLAAVAIAMQIRNDPGIATLAGIVVYFLMV